MKRTAKTKTKNEKVLDITANEARLLVASYYAAQTMRKRLDSQIRHLGKRAEMKVDEGDDRAAFPPFMSFVGDAWAQIETDVAKMLERYARASRVGSWCLAQHAIGPVITAGLIAHLDITRAPTASNFFSFAGLNPAMAWKEGQKRPYNADLKQITFHIGECFKRAWKHPDCYYGRIYAERKTLLVLRNESGVNAERAKSYRTTSADVRKKLKSGKLPDGNIDRQACNYAAKMFLAHLHAVMLWDKYKKVRIPYAIEHLGHAHPTKIFHTEELFPGFLEAYHEIYPLAEAAE